MGETNGDVVAVSPEGGLLIGGCFTGSLEFHDETASDGGVTDQTSCFIARLNEDYNAVNVYVWGSYHIVDLAVDARGSLYVLSGICQPARIIPDDPSSIVAPAGDTDLLVTKLSPDLSVEWYRALGSAVGRDLEDYFGGIAVHQTGEVYVAGAKRVETAVTMPPRGGMDVDSFVLKFNEKGETVWGMELSGPDKDVVDDVAVDSSGNLVVAGHFSDAVRFVSPVEEETHESQGGPDAFVIQVGPEGGIRWYRQWGGSGSVVDCRLEIGQDGSVYVGGYLGGPTADFTPGPAVGNVGPRGDTDFFVSRFTADGEYQWTGFLGGTGTERWPAIAVDSTGRIWVGGLAYNDGAHLDEPESFLGVMDAEGTALRQETWNAFDLSDMCVDEDDRLYVIGSFSETVAFGFGENRLVRQTEELSDIYILVVDTAEGLNNSRFGV